MPLVSIAAYLKRAQLEHFAVPLFDVEDSNCVEGVLLAAEEKKAPVIIAMYARLFDLPNIRAMAAYVRRRAQESSVPVSLMLDHGASFENVIKAIAFGFTDVMYDGSRLPIEQNIANSRSAAQAAHAVGIMVEAELGHVGQASDYRKISTERTGFTDPATVAGFVEATGVDALAVAIGNAHGQYVGDPKLDLDLLRDIRSRIDVPLVLHGGSGIFEDDFRAAIRDGIAKINIATDLRLATRDGMIEAAKSDRFSYFDVAKVTTEGFRVRCGYHFDLFGATGKAR
jgi:fructose-bisphosphate aldolase, class II